MVRQESGLVYLAYFDDSGTDAKSDLCVFGGIVIPGDAFGHAESWASTAVSYLDMGDSFTEFKAGELYFANGRFAGRDQKKCREAFHLLLNTMVRHNTPFIYSAVHKPTLQKESLLGSAAPLDVAFRMCLGQLEQWARREHWDAQGGYAVTYADMCVVIADECDAALKKQMLASFREKRRKHPFLTTDGHTIRESLFHIHDSMYFGASTDSVGLQVADAANWAMHRVLRGAEVDDLVIDQLKKCAMCAKPEPDWSRYRHLFRSHEDVFGGAAASEQTKPS